MTNLIDDLIQFQKKLDEKTVAEYTDDLYEAMRQLILNEVKLLDKEEVKKFIVENLCLTPEILTDVTAAPGIETRRTLLKALPNV